MTDSSPEGFKPAPWEAGGKKKTQGPQAQPPGYAAPPPGYGPPPAPAAFGGEDMGRGRTRQIPNQPPQGGDGPMIGQPFSPRQHDAGAQAPPPPAYGGGPPPQYPPQAGYPGQVPPQGQPYPPPPQPQQPYGDPNFVPKKPITILGVIALVLAGVGCLVGLLSLGFFSWPFFIAGGILGYLGLRETAAWGRKSGRGVAMGGTIANGALLALNAVGVVGLLWLGSSTVDLVERNNNAFIVDGPLIQSRLFDYAKAKGDLKPGGPQMRKGFENPTAVTGPQLTVQDLVMPSELKNPIEQYSLEIAGDTATIWWSPPDGQRQEVGSYGRMASFDEFDFDSEFQPPPRSK
ncbi:MAG: hypothetical protein K8I27_04110 [Planctomycetes bacterium]|nr:hypothetical protein [Planctomycetota bacterium]